MTQRSDLDLTCYVYPGWEPRLRPGVPRRTWMDAAPERFPYRCLPLDIANAHGWEILSPVGFEAEWNGGSAVDDVTVRPDAGSPVERVPVALFGQGVLTFHVEGLFRTPPGYNLWVGGIPNAAKDGIAPLGAIIETDWSPYSFTMNWRFTRPHQPIRFEENEPFAFIFPVERGLIERIRPDVRPIGDDPELQESFEHWSASRDAFQARIAADPPASPSGKWQKFYYRGVGARGEPGVPDHQSKLRLSEFDGAMPYPSETRTPPATCPVAKRPEPASTPGPAPAPALGQDTPAEKLAWLMSSLEQLRGLSQTRIPRREGIGGDEFLHQHYAANWPALLVGELAGWPAVERWTPDYLREKVGPRPVQIQVDRNADADFERNMAAHSTSMPFDAFIDSIAQPGAGNDRYLTAYNSAANQEALAPLQPDLGFIPKLLKYEAGHPSGFMWIGPAGTFTPLHHDLTNNLLLQISGRKRVLMVPPTETPRLYNDHHVYSRVRDLLEPGIVGKFPGLDGLRVHEVILQPGEALFIPLGWWHQVTSLDFSVTITHTNFVWPNAFYSAYPSR
ncbi:DUF6065 family protein [Novosphingobium sp. BL-8A]|uniref:DUF6065 family protein n=1 Tax=Novosphingobium sp. BL-8A TaxID=3127639 RepID=UPI003756B307